MRKIAVSLLATAAILSVSAAQASIFLVGETDLGGQGFGNAPALLSVQETGTESAVISIVGGQLVGGGPGISDASVFMGNGITNSGGDEVSPLTDSQKFGIPTLGELQWNDGADVRLLFNANEPGGNGITITDVTLKFFNGDTLVAAIDNSAPIVLNSTLTGQGSSGFLLAVDAEQQAFLNTTVFSNPASAGFRIALESTLMGAAGGAESFRAIIGTINPPSEVPLPGAAVLFLSGVVGLGAIGRMKKKSARVSATA